jgi:hypothetical protein
MQLLDLRVVILNEDLLPTSLTNGKVIETEPELDPSQSSDNQSNTGSVSQPLLDTPQSTDNQSDTGSVTHSIRSLNLTNGEDDKSTLGKDLLIRCIV